MIPDEPPLSLRRRWVTKFACAFRGVAAGMRGQNSFLVHVPVAVAVVVTAAVLRAEPWHWCVLLLCVALVFALELMNSSIEMLIRRLHPERHTEIGRALDVASGAVLVGVIGAVVVGLLVVVDLLW